MIRSKKIKDSARGEDCSLRLIGSCNSNSETTILAHIGKDRGTAIKCHDTFAVYACSDCHDAIDGRVPYNELANPNIQDDLLRALEETQSKLIGKGLLHAE